MLTFQSSLRTNPNATFTCTTPGKCQKNTILKITFYQNYIRKIFLTKSETTDLRWSVGLTWNADFSEMELQTKTASVLPIFTYERKIEVNNPEEKTSEPANFNEKIHRLLIETFYNITLTLQIKISMMRII